MLPKVSPKFLLLLACSLVLILAAENGFSAEAKTESFSINGVVRSNKGQPLENVRVSIKGAGDFVTTDSRGHFTIPFKNANQRFFQWDITAAKKGYLNNGARYTPDSGDLDITLQAIPDFDSPEYQAQKQDKDSGIDGFVVNGNGMPLENARVRIMGKDSFVTTDAEGRFTVPLNNPGQRLFQWIVAAGKEG